MSRHICPGPGCARCQRLIDEREFGTDALSDSESARLDNWAERQMEANWP